MTKDDRFDKIFAALKKLLKPLEPELIVKADAPTAYYLDTPTKRDDGYVFAFGGVQVGKRYVSYHLMPVYAEPALLEGVSDALKKRMRGKSCFNFTRTDPALFDELGALTRRGLELFRQQGFL